MPRERKRELTFRRHLVPINTNIKNQELLIIKSCIISYPLYNFMATEVT
jgi:hypothetical protein